MKIKKPILIKLISIIVFLSCHNLIGNSGIYDDYADLEETRPFWEQPLGIIIIIIVLIYYITK